MTPKAADPPTITVLTPTYNRAHVLPRVYESLVRQTYHDFEWVIVDDGSDDGTRAIVQSWIRTGSFDIQYVEQPNRGKHVAVNRGIELARGEFTSIVDSDDWLRPDALKRLVQHWYDIPRAERSRFSGVVGLCVYENGEVVGDCYPQDLLDSDPVELRYVHRVDGDKQSLLRTTVLREFPFLYEELGGYVPEAIVWNRMALKYRERYVNEVVLTKNYESDGISHHALVLQIRAALATRQFYLEELLLPRPLKRSRRLRSYANYVRFSLHANIGWRKQATQAPSKPAWLATGVPVGTLLYLRDRVVVK